MFQVRIYCATDAHNDIAQGPEFAPCYDISPACFMLAFNVQRTLTMVLPKQQDLHHAMISPQRVPACLLSMCNRCSQQIAQGIKVVNHHAGSPERFTMFAFSAQQILTANYIRSWICTKPWWLSALLSPASSSFASNTQRLLRPRLQIIRIVHLTVQRKC